MWKLPALAQPYEWVFHSQRKPKISKDTTSSLVQPSPLCSRACLSGPGSRSEREWRGRAALSTLLAGVTSGHRAIYIYNSPTAPDSGGANQQPPSLSDSGCSNQEVLSVQPRSLSLNQRSAVAPPGEGSLTQVRSPKSVSRCILYNGQPAEIAPVRVRARRICTIELEAGFTSESRTLFRPSTYPTLLCYEEIHVKRDVSFPHCQPLPNSGLSTWALNPQVPLR